MTSLSGQTCPFPSHGQHQAPNTSPDTPAAQPTYMNCFSQVLHRVPPPISLLPPPSQIRQGGPRGDKNGHLESSAQGSNSTAKQPAGPPQTSPLLSPFKERNTRNTFNNSSNYLPPCGFLETGQQYRASL